MSTYAPATRTKASDAELLKKARRCFKTAWEASDKQRKREREDLRFQVPEEQWDESAKRARSGDNLTPGRPTLSISKIDQPIQLVLNQARAAKLGVNIHPVSEKADDDTAEVMQGIYRRIERDSPADQARLWALDRATKAGRGAYRVNTRWDEDAPETFDQEIVIERILYQDLVFFDPSATKPDFSDGKWCFVGAWMDVEDFKREYPHAKIPGEDSTFESMPDDQPMWVKGDGDTRGILVTEYWYKTFEAETIVDPTDPQRTRTKQVPTVHKSICSGLEVLDDEIWNGQYIPVIPVIGRELQPYDDERRWVGMIGPSKDGQKLYNFAASTLVERMAMEPKTPWVADAKSIEGYEDLWKQSNTRNFTLLPYNSIVQGQVLPPPQRAQLDQTGMSLAMMALQEADSFIQATTSIYDPSLGRRNPRDESGVAKKALQSQSDAATSHYLASLADVSMVYEARVVLDLIPHIYDRPGRITRILGGEDETRAVMLNAPFTMDAQGRPVAAMDGDEGAKVHDLKAGTYSISVSIGKSFQTRLEQGQTEIGEILAAQPGLMPLLGATYFRFRDFPGAKEIADILKKVRDKQMPDLEEGKDGKPTPEQLQGQISAMQAQGQQIMQQLQLAVEQIKTDQAKQQAMIAKAQIDAAKEIKLQEMKDAASIAVAQINAEAKGLQMATEAQNEEKATGIEHAFAADQANRDRAHEVAVGQVSAQQQAQQTAQAQQHEVGMSGADREASAEEQEAQRAHEGSQASQAQAAAAEEAERGREAAAEQAEMASQREPTE